MTISSMILGLATMCSCLAFSMAVHSSDSSQKLTRELNTVKELLVVRGAVGPDSGLFFPFYRIPANDRNLKLASRLPGEGSHSVVFIDINGQDLLKIAWTPKFIQEPLVQKPDKVPFTWLVIPPPNVAEVHLQIAGRKVSGFQVSTKAPTIEDLKIEFIRDSSDLRELKSELTWSLSPIPPEDSKKPLRILYQIYYSNDDRETWILVKSGFEKPAAIIDLGKLPGGRSCFFRVVVTDGFNSSAKVSRSFSILDKPPSCALIAPRSNKTYRAGAGLLLVGRCVDHEDGSLPDENLVWISDLQGVLGYGRKLVKRNLHIGSHRITLTCRDSASNECVSQPLELEIIPRLTKPRK